MHHNPGHILGSQFIPNVSGSTLRLASISIATFLILHTAIAQQNPTSERKILIFTQSGNQSSAKNPTSPTPSPALSPRGSKENSLSPPEIVSSFFDVLASGQISQAYRFLLRGSILSDRRDEIEAIQSRTKDAIDQYGPFSTFEILDQQPVGNSLLRLTCLSLNSDLPLRWRFYFYKPKDSWMLVDLRIDDGIVEIFEERKKR